MNKRSYPWYALCALAIFIASSCSFGLQPLSSKNNTIVALRLSSLAQTDGAKGGRAIVQGSGYLYMRTLGGPTGSSGPLYGPYPITSDTKFKTADIPSGSYSDIALLFSANPIDETKTIDWKGSAYSFSQFMRLPDAEWVALLNDNGVSFDGLFNGETSTGMTGAITVRENKMTNLSVVLIPVTDAGYYLDVAAAPSRTLPAQASMVRKFFEIGGLGATLSASEFEVSCAVTPGKAPLSLGIVALYASDGTLIRNFGAIGSLTEAKTLTATVKKAAYYFLYIEYQSAEPITLGLTAAVKSAPATPDEPPVGGSALTVNFAGSGTVANKYFYYSVYDVSEYFEDPLTEPYLYGPIGTLCGYGAIALDSSGNGSSTVLAPGGSAFSASMSGMYAVYGFVDMNSPSPRYAGTYPPGAALTAEQVKNIVPRYGDGWTEDPIACSPLASSTVTVTVSDLAGNENAVFFVDAASDGSGLTADDPRGINYVLSEITAYQSVILYFTADSMTMPNPTGVAFTGTRLELCAAPGRNPSSEKPVLYAGPSLTTPLFIASPASSCQFILHDVTIHGSGATAMQSAALMINNHTTLILGNGLTIRDFAFTTDDQYGGGVHAVSSMVVMLGNSLITGLTTTGAGTFGGGLFLDNSSCYMFGSSSIQDCTGWVGGGGIVVTGTETGIFVNMSDTSSITGCMAGSGGGIYLTANGMMFFSDTARVTGNDATTIGGGVYTMNPSETNNAYSEFVFNNMQDGSPEASGIKK